MKLHENRDHIANLLKDTIVSFCKNFIPFKFVLNIEAFVVLTCDEENVLVVKIDDSYKGNCGVLNTDTSHDASFGPGTTSKLYALSSANKPVKVRQPLSLQYSNWNSATGGPQVLKQPRATKKAPQSSKNIPGLPRGMAFGQRMSAVRSRTNGQRPNVQLGARRMTGVRQRMPNFSRNVITASNSSQKMALLPMANFGKRMSSMPNMPRQSLPVQNTQLALQYVPRRLDSAEPSLAVCDVASNEIVETTSPARYLDESREQMFRDVVSDALSKLDGIKPAEHSPLRKVSESNPPASECIMALVPLPQTVPIASRALPQKLDANDKLPANPQTQTGQNFPCLTLNSNVNRPALSIEHGPEKTSRSSSHLQISLITKSNSNSSVQPPATMQPTIRPNPNPLPVQWSRLISGSAGYPSDQPDPASIWPTQVVRANSASVHQGSIPSVQPPPRYGLVGQVNSGFSQWPDSGSRPTPRLQQASYLANDLKNQLHNIFDKQVQPVQQIQNVYSQQIHPRYVSPSKSNSIGVVGSSWPFQSSQSHQTNIHFQTQLTNPHFMTGRESNTGMVYYHSNANLYQLTNSQDILAREPTSQERNFYNKVSPENVQSNYPTNTFVQYSLQIPVLQNSMSPLNFSTIQQSSTSQQQFMAGNLHMGRTTLTTSQQQFMAGNLHMGRPTMVNTSQQQVIQFKAANPSAVNVTRNHYVPRSLMPTSGAVVPPSPIDSLSSLSSSSLQKPQSSAEYLIIRDPPSSLYCATMTKPIDQTLLSLANANPTALQLALGVVTSTKALSIHSTESNKSRAIDSKVLEKRLPPLRLKNLGHGNLMVIDPSRNESFKNGEVHIPGKEEDLEAIAMSQVMIAMEGLKEYSARKMSNENPFLSSCKISIEQEITGQHEATALTADADISDRNFKTNVKINANSLSPNPNNESTSQIIRDVRLSSVNEFCMQNDTDLISRNLSLDVEPVMETFGVFDVCRNEVVVTRNGNNVRDSSSDERLSVASDQTMENPVDVLQIGCRERKNASSDSSDTTELPDLNSRVDSCCDVNFYNNSQGQYTCQACQINMDSNTMLAEHYSTFHTIREVHWREHEVRPYLDRMEQGSSSDGQCATLQCPFEGCDRSFTGSRQAIAHYSKTHKTKMTYKQIMTLKSKEGSLVRCNYCKMKFPTKRLLQEHVSRMH